MKADDLFTAPQVAKICSTDLKTIHNWVNRGEIKSFRTPGRHLRFRREDIYEFLQKYGYPIPDGFSPARKRVILCEGKDAMRRSIKRTLSRDYEVEAFSDHVDALLAIGRQRPALLLVNGQNGTEITHLVQRLTSDKDASPVVVYGTEKLDGNMDNDLVQFVASSESKDIRRSVMSLLDK